MNDLPAILAQIESSRGKAPVTLTDLTEVSAFAQTSIGFEFRDAVKIQVADQVVSAEVAFIEREEPRGVVLVFEENEVIHGLLEQLQNRAAAGAPWSESTEPEPAEVDLSITPAPIETGQNLVEAFKEKTPHDRSLHEAVRGVRTDTTLEVQSTDPALLPVEVRPLSAAPEHGATRTAPELAPVEPELPELTADGVLHFASVFDFRANYERDISQGGLVARSVARYPLGTQRLLRLSVPGSPKMFECSARVGFVGDGKVGFMIDSFPAQKPKLEAFLEQLS